MGHDNQHDSYKNITHLTLALAAIAQVVGSNPGRVKPKTLKLVVVASLLKLGAMGTALHLNRRCQYNGPARFSPWAPHKCPCAIMIEMSLHSIGKNAGLLYPIHFSL